MEILVAATTNVLLGVLCAIPGSLSGKLLSRQGIVRDYKIKPVVLTTVMFFVARLFAPDVPIGWMIGLGVLYSTIGVYRGDFLNTSRHGGWWWMQDDFHDNPITDLVISVVVIVGVVAIVWLLAR